MDTSIKNQIQNSKMFLNNLKDKQLSSFLEGVKEGEKNPLLAINVPFKLVDSQKITQDKYKLFIDSLQQSLQENKNLVLKNKCKHKGGYLKKQQKFTRKTNKPKQKKKTKKKKMYVNCNNSATNLNR